MAYKIKVKQSFPTFQIQSRNRAVRNLEHILKIFKIGKKEDFSSVHPNEIQLGL